MLLLFFFLAFWTIPREALVCVWSLFGHHHGKGLPDACDTSCPTARLFMRQSLIDPDPPGTADQLAVALRDIPQEWPGPYFPGGLMIATPERWLIQWNSHSGDFFYGLLWFLIFLVPTCEQSGTQWCSTLQLISPGVNIQVIFICVAVTVIAALWGVVPPQMEKCRIFIKFLHAVGLFMATSVCLPWWMLPYDYESGPLHGVQFLVAYIWTITWCLRCLL